MSGGAEETRTPIPRLAKIAGCRQTSGVVADLLGSSTGTDLRRCPSAGLAVRMAVRWETATVVIL
jgi:hypothetical protein